MLRWFRRRLQGLGGSMRQHERSHGHYSRAFGLLIQLAVLALAILAIVMAQQQPYADVACRVRSDAAQARVLALDIELARTSGEIRQRLAGEMALTRTGPVPATICIAERADRYTRLLALDGALFIPAYLLLAGLVICWLLAMSVHAVEADGHWRPPRRAFARLLLLSAVTVLVTAWLDARENRAALTVLELASGLGALAQPMAAGLDHAVAAAYRDSLHKWLATAAWTATLAALVWHQRSVLARACGSGWRGRAGRVLMVLFIVLAGASTLALLIGAGGGLLFASSGTNGAAPWIHALIAAGFVAVAGCGLALSLLDFVRSKVVPVPSWSDLSWRLPPEG